MTIRPSEAARLLDLLEDMLAALGFAVVSDETAAALARFERRPDLATEREIAGLRYALAATRWAERFPVPTETLLQRKFCVIG